MMGYIWIHGHGLQMIKTTSFPFNILFITIKGVWTFTLDCRLALFLLPRQFRGNYLRYRLAVVIKILYRIVIGTW